MRPLATALCAVLLADSVTSAFVFSFDPAYATSAYAASIAAEEAVSPGVASSTSCSSVTSRVSSTASSSSSSRAASIPSTASSSSSSSNDSSVPFLWPAPSTSLSPSSRPVFSYSQALSSSQACSFPSSSSSSYPSEYFPVLTDVDFMTDIFLSDDEDKDKDESKDEADDESKDVAEDEAQSDEPFNPVNEDTVILAEDEEFDNDVRDWLAKDGTPGMNVMSKQLSTIRQFAYRLLLKRMNRELGTRFITIPWTRILIHGLPGGVLQGSNPYDWNRNYLARFFESRMRGVTFTLKPRRQQKRRSEAEINRYFYFYLKQALNFLGLKRLDHSTIEWAKIYEFAPGMVLSTHNPVRFTHEDRHQLNDHIIIPATHRGLVLTS